MRGILTRLAGRGRAFRAVAILLAVSLLTSLVADLHLHTAHAGHAHGAHSLFASAVDDAAAARDVAVDGDQVLEQQQAGLDGQSDDGNEGKADSAHAQCCLTFLWSDQHAFLSPPQRPVTGMRLQPTVRSSLPSLPDRPPRVSL